MSLLLRVFIRSLETLSYIYRFLLAIGGSDGSATGSVGTFERRYLLFLRLSIPCISELGYHLNEIVTDDWQLEVSFQVRILVGFILLKSPLVGGEVVYKAQLPFL